MILRKAFYRSWSASIPQVALTEEVAFAAFRVTILLAGPHSDRNPQFWDGNGNFLSNLRPGLNQRFCGYADLSFTVVLSEKAFAELQPFLEDPAAKMAAARESDATVEAMVAKIRAQVMGESIPEDNDHGNT